MIKRFGIEYETWLVTLTGMKSQVRSRVVCYLKLKPCKERVESPDRKFMILLHLEKAPKVCLVYHTVEIHSHDASLSGKISLLIMVVASGTQNRGARYFSLILLYCLNFYHMYIASSSKPINIGGKKGITVTPEKGRLLSPF